MVKLEHKIRDFRIVEGGYPTTPRQELTEAMARPEVLLGSTYKLKTPLSEHALYVTVNDIILNEGTEHEERRPFEIFINSKDMTNFQWIVALTRIMSAVFRKGGDMAFLVEELRSVFDPKGGYFKKGKYVHSLVAEIGDVVELHLTNLGLLSKATPLPIKEELKGASLESASVCPKCQARALVSLDNCLTCLECGHSKCG